MILLSSVSFFKCRADKFCTFASFNAFKLLFNLLTTDFPYSFSACSSSKEGSLSFGRLAAISDLPLAENVSDTRYTVLTTQTNTFRKTFTKFEHVKILMFHKNVHYKDIRSGSSSQMSQQLPSVSWWRCMRGCSYWASGNYPTSGGLGFTRQCKLTWFSLRQWWH